MKMNADGRGIRYRALAKDPSENKPVSSSEHHGTSHPLIPL